MLSRQQVLWSIATRLSSRRRPTEATLAHFGLVRHEMLTQTDLAAQQRRLFLAAVRPAAQPVQILRALRARGAYTTKDPEVWHQMGEYRHLEVLDCFR